MNPKPRQGRKNPFPCDRQNSVAPPETNAPKHKADKPQSLEAAKSSAIAVLESSCFPRFEITPVQLHRRRLRRTKSSQPRPSSRLRVRPFRLNHRRMAARIARRRKKLLFPPHGSTHLEHSQRRQRTTSPLPPGRGPRPGGATDDSPARERWVSSPHETSPGGATVPLPVRAPRNTK